jgi:hypothetical protein
MLEIGKTGDERAVQWTILGRVEGCWRTRRPPLNPGDCCYARPGTGWSTCRHRRVVVVG